MTIQFPYGLADFYALITENYLYIDRTDHIPLIEKAGRQLIFLRPRRFGKSLWLSVLENYYDIARVDEFDKLFGNLAIGKHPTPRRNSYFVLKWDFSIVNAQGSAGEITRNLNSYLNAEIKAFALRYKNHLNTPNDIDPE